MEVSRAVAAMRYVLYLAEVAIVEGSMKTSQTILYKARFLFRFLFHFQGSLLLFSLFGYCLAYCFCCCLLFCLRSCLILSIAALVSALSIEGAQRDFCICTWVSSLLSFIHVLCHLLILFANLLTHLIILYIV